MDTMTWIEKILTCIALIAGIRYSWIKGTEAKKRLKKLGRRKGE